MRQQEDDLPVGAEWQAQDGITYYRVYIDREQGSIYRGGRKTRYLIWYVEVYQQHHPDGGKLWLHRDWYPNMSSAFREVRGWINSSKKTRLRRVK